MPQAIVIGAGPAGLTTAYELSKLGMASTVLEADQLVGGLSRTVEYKGYRFDIGGHRFFSKVELINELWSEILAEEDFLQRPRLSRIFYKNHFFDYPLKPTNALMGLGPVESFLVMLSYAKARLLPSKEMASFEAWVSARFGHRLYRAFFKTYTEKVWGIPCSEISADWAAQRIKNLSLTEVIRNALFKADTAGDGSVVTTLIDKFHYPRLGPGMMWDRCQALLADVGSQTIRGVKVNRVRHARGRVECIYGRSNSGETLEFGGDQFFSTMPLRSLIRAMDPPPPDEVLRAADLLRYRDYLTVVLIVKRDEVFPDNWLYIHAPEVRMGRIQNYKNWSPEMVPDPSRTSLGLEYFLWDVEDHWSWSDDQLIDLGIRECTAIGLVESEEIEDGTVVRMRKAYPVYDHEYLNAVETIRRYLSGFENLQTLGRNGMHRYNNQDHSMLTGIYAARNVMGAEYDIWSVNVEKEYHEEDKSAAAGGRAVPRRAVAPTEAEAISVPELMAAAFAKLDAVALGTTCGLLAGFGFFLATAILLIKGGEHVGGTLVLLQNYLIGYRISWSGAIVGSAEAAVGGFCLAYLGAQLRNLMMGAYASLVLRFTEPGRRVDVSCGMKDSGMESHDRRGNQGEVSRVMARLKAGVLALVFGMIGGFGLFFMTVWLLVKGGENVGSHLELLSHYFIGYSVTWPGALIGLVYGALVGGSIGWVIGFIYNRMVVIRHGRGVI